MVKREFLLISFVFLFLFGCASAPVNSTPTNSGVEYYSTYNEVTRRDYPEEDWPYIAEMRNVPPVEVVIEYVWINYDANGLALSVLDTTNGFRQCIEFLFVDVTVTTGSDWLDAELVYTARVSCDELDASLEDGLGKLEI